MTSTVLATKPLIPRGFVVYTHTIPAKMMSKTKRKRYSLLLAASLIPLAAVIGAVATAYVAGGIGIDTLASFIIGAILGLIVGAIATARIIRRANEHRLKTVSILFAVANTLLATVVALNSTI